MQPTIGRIVHYQSYGTPGGEYLPAPRAAIITDVTTEQLVPGGELVEVASVCVLNPTGMFFNTRVPFAETPTPGCWNWPPREPVTVHINTGASIKDAIDHHEEVPC